MVLEVANRFKSLLKAGRIEVKMEIRLNSRRKSTLTPMCLRALLIALTCGLAAQAAPATAFVGNHPAGHLDGIFTHQFTLAGDRKPLGPTTYQNWGEHLAAQAKQSDEDRSWALANVTPVVEGPWGSIASTKVYYFGIDAAGKRITLPEISNLWRFRPETVQIPASDHVHDTYYVVTSNPDIVIPIELGPLMPGILIERPRGEHPLEAKGLIDGKDFYLRQRDGYWSFSIGGADVMSKPEWYHEESDYTRDVPDTGTVYAFIARVAALYRTGASTMTNGLRQ